MSIRNMSEHGFGGRTPSHNLKFPTQRPFYQLLSLVLSISALGGTLILTSAAATVPRQVSAPAFVPRGANMIGTGAVMFGSSTLGQVIATASDPSMPVEVSVSQPISVQLPSGPGLAVNVMVAAGNRSGLLAPATQFNNRNCGYDGSYSVYECLTMYYNIKNGATYFYGDVEQYSDVVINEDPTSVVLSNLTMQAGVAGTDCNGGGSNGGQTQPWNLGTPTSGTTYYKSPSWAGSYFRLLNAFHMTQTGTSTLTWYYRGNVQHLVFSYTLPDSLSQWPRNGGCSNP